MFKDEEVRKFMLYAAATGLLIILMACMLQLCFVPGSECKIPFVSVDETETLTFEQAPDYTLKEGADYQANFYTNKGNFVVDLYEKNAPDTVNNFVFLASKGYYDGVSFHRLFKDLLVQTGDRNTLDKDTTNDGLGGPGYVIKDEINWKTAGIPPKQQEELTAEGYTNDPDVESKPFRTYTLAMANSGKPNTNGSQFFITMSDESNTKIASLRGRHTVFGRLVSGFDVIDKINQVKVNDTDPNVPIPKEKIVITKVEIVEITKDEKTVKSGSDQTVKFSE